MEDKLERPTTSEELTTCSGSQRAEVQIQMPTVSIEHLEKIFLCHRAGINKGLNLFMCSLDIHRRSLRLLHLGLHVKILNLTCEGSAMPVHLVQMNESRQSPSARYANSYTINTVTP